LDYILNTLILLEQYTQFYFTNLISLIIPFLFRLLKYVFLLLTTSRSGYRIVLINVFNDLLFLVFYIIFIDYEIVVFLNDFIIKHTSHFQSHNSLTIPIHLLFHHLSQYLVLNLFLICLTWTLQYYQLFIELIESHTVHILLFISINVIECYFLSFFETFVIELYYFPNLSFPYCQLLSIVFYIIYFELYFRKQHIWSVGMVGNIVITNLSWLSIMISFISTISESSFYLLSTNYELLVYFMIWFSCWIYTISHWSLINPFIYFNSFSYISMIFYFYSTIYS